MYQLAVNFPIHNEEQSILKVLYEWEDELKKLNIDYCLIISEDGSNDKTKFILKNNSLHTPPHCLQEKPIRSNLTLHTIGKNHQKS